MDGTYGVSSAALVLSVLVLLGAGDTVLGAVLFDEYTTVFSVFINQFTGICYGIGAAVALGIRQRRRRKARSGSIFEEGAHASADPLLADSKLSSLGGNDAPTKLAPKWWILATIGVMNGSGNFLAAIGQPHTPGETQAGLTLIGIPLVMVMSRVFLGKKVESWMTALAVACIFLGSFVTTLPAMLKSDDSNSKESETHWYSVLFFFFAQFFFGGEKVFEESVFTSTRCDALVMFFWTMWVQVVLGFFLLPLQGLKNLGNLPLSELGETFWQGLRCTMTGHDDANATASVDFPVCTWREPVTMFAYISVDGIFYLLGLYVIQRGGANLVVLATALALPLSQVIFALRGDHFYWEYGIGLVLSLGGFIVYYRRIQSSMRSE